MGAVTSTITFLFDLYRVVSDSQPAFVAGFEVDRAGLVIRAAPILKRWVLGRHLDDVLGLCALKSWRVEHVGGQVSDRAADRS
jgi:hypothetical protein